MDMKNYSAGFARLDITPPLGVTMIGAGPRKTKGVLDPLQVNAVAFGGEDKSAVILVCDLLGMYGKFGDEWPAEIAEKLGLDKGSVFIHCTHTHTGPSPSADKEYLAWLFRRLCDAAQIALDDRKPVIDVQWAEGMTEDLIFTRRYLMRDGRVETHPVAGNTGNPDIVRHYSDPDETVRLVRIIREEGREIVLTNSQNHPDRVGGEYVSADWPAAVRSRIEQERPGVHCIYMNGCQGQLVPGTKLRPHIPKSHKSAMELGNKMAEAMLPLFDKTVSTGMTGLGFAQKTLALKSIPSKAHPEPPEYWDMVASVITFCGLGVGGLCGEPVSEVGEYVRANSKYPVSFVCCQTNGARGYLPMESYYGLPGTNYEANTTRLAPGGSEQLMNAVLELLNNN